MGFSRSIFIFALLSHGASASVWGSCLLKLREAKLSVNGARTAVMDIVRGRKPHSVDHGKLFDESRAARAEAKESPDLKITKGEKIRKPEEVEAWLVNFSNKVKATRDGSQSKMSVEEFFGMIDGGFGRAGFHFEDIFKEYNIKTVRLVKKKTFDSIIHKTSADAQAKDELLIEVPDFPLDDPSAAAIWIKDLHMSLHDAATNMIAKKMDGLSKKEATAEWSRKYKSQVQNMDRGVRAVLEELKHYLKSKHPTAKNVLDLPKRGLSPDVWHHGISLYKATDALVGGVAGAKVGQMIAGDEGTFYGGVAGSLLGIVVAKVKFPLNTWKPSRKWLVSKEAFEIERERLSARLASYYTYKIMDKTANRIAGAIVTGTALTMAYYFIQQKSLVGDAEEGMDEEAEKSTAKLDIATEEQLSKLNVEELNQRYSKLALEEQELNALKQDALKKKDRARAAKLNDELVAKVKYMQKVLAQIEALNPEGIEYER